MLPCPKGKGQKSRKPCPHLPIVEMQAGPSVYGLPRCLYYRVRRLNDCEDSPPPDGRKSSAARTETTSTPLFWSVAR